MSNKLTRITLPGTAFKGFQEWDEQTPEHMIKRARSIAANLRRQAEAIETACDEDFQIDVVLGPIVQHHIKELQKAAPSSLPEREQAQ